MRAVDAGMVRRNIKLASSKAPQSFAFDGHTLYVLQLTSIAFADRRGHLTVSRVDMVTGKLTGRMWLRGFDHGVSFGVDRTGGTVWLWLAADPIRVKGSARGTRIVRVPFQNGKTVSSAAPIKQIASFNFQEPCTPSISGDALAVRTGSLVRCYDLAAARQGELKLLGKIRFTTGDRVFQGWCLDTGVVVTVTGAVGQAAQVRAHTPTGLLWSFTDPHPPAGHREPEGVAVYGNQVVYGYSTGSPKRLLRIHAITETP